MDLVALATAVDRAAERGRLRQEVAVLRAQARSTTDVAIAPTFDPTLEQLINLAAKNSDAPVLLQGETGTGKGFVARQIHDRSLRNHSPFVEINCASLSATFFESELFGHERGAFTDAKQAKRGLLEVAGNGTVFLDEVAEMTLDVQPRLLKVLEDHTFRRLGGTTLLRSNARVIVATHQPLSESVADRRFRADLYYRLQVLTLTIPPLRARVSDIAPLARAFLPRGAALDATAEAALQAYSWPGNVRELKNAIWRAAILSDGAPISERHLGLSATEPNVGSSAPTRPYSPQSLELIERSAIRRALDVHADNRTRAARELGIARSTLLEKIKRYGI